MRAPWQEVALDRPHEGDFAEKPRHRWSAPQRGNPPHRTPLRRHAIARRQPPQATRPHSARYRARRERRRQRASEAEVWELYAAAANPDGIPALLGGHARASALANRDARRADREAGATRTTVHGARATISSSKGRTKAARFPAITVTRYPAACSASASLTTRGFDARWPGLTMQTERRISRRSAAARRRVRSRRPARPGRMTMGAYGPFRAPSGA